jgi:hypothetical protein
MEHMRARPADVVGVDDVDEQARMVTYMATKRRLGYRALGDTVA